ncbi:MAG: ATP-grasp domain-containing protein [Ignavibacteriaceae bacterium]
MKTNTKVLICYNSPVSIFSIYSGNPEEKNSNLKDLSEKGFSNEIEKIRKSLQAKFKEVTCLAINGNVRETIFQINKNNPDIIFNFVECVEGIASYEYCIAGLYELLGFNYTGNIPSCLGNCLNKERTKNILRSFGIPTPKSLIIHSSRKIDEKSFNLKFPVILKLLNEDASIGISEHSVVKNFKDVKNRLKFLFKTYKQDVIAEEFIEGRELNAAILGNKILPISEIMFNGLPEDLPKIVTYDSKWIEESVYYKNTKPNCPAKISDNVKKKVEQTTLAAFQAMNCRDYARVDIRLNKNNIPYVIEVNPNPDISIDSGFARAAAAEGFSHTDLLFTIANFALARKLNDTKNKAS